MAKLTDREKAARYYDALKRIASYQSATRLLTKSWDDWGLDDGTEALEYAYENVREEAKRAIKGHRRPAPEGAP